MVMVTRSAYRKGSFSSTNSDYSCKNSKPPWCSSSKVSEKRKPRKVSTQSWEAESSPLRETIWEYLYEDKTEQRVPSKRTARPRKQRSEYKGGKTTLILLIFLVITMCMMASLWISNRMPRLDQITKLIVNEKFTSLLSMEDFTSVDVECCNRMKYLAAELLRAEKTLRYTLRLQKSMMLTSENKKYDKVIDGGYIDGATVTIGRDTIEWDGRVSLWGVVPLWRTARPPDTILALRKPTPADCWPFSGSQGEVIIELPRPRRLRCVSIEHIKPDTTSSAPNHFTVYGILQNGTWIKTLEGEYRKYGPAKQYYLLFKHTSMKRIVLRVLSNQGNPKYTCIYRFHVYGDTEDHIDLLKNIYD